ncbi:CLUMA_CG018747, isoform A [Clunio marinus]|uniref:CLUMA_CG018747, isoform A n=1 Tax=Clunio marinus TaxID=568069 RepID=A0A1J1IZT3_9DIPT|nr:CLUMA_CG018747, isoform A [Clunio marinus]
MKTILSSVNGRFRSKNANEFVSCDESRTMIRDELHNVINPTSDLNSSKLSSKNQSLVAISNSSSGIIPHHTTIYVNMNLSLVALKPFREVNGDERW